MSEAGRLLILYGSQTFTAQEIAERIWRTSKILGFIGPVQAMDEYPISLLIREEFALFVCSTTGQGDEPDNMKKFWKFLLRKNLPETSLKRLKFGVLGLGDSSYAKFNFTGKRLHKRLVQLGATPLVDIGLCDYQHDLGHDAVQIPWTNEFFTKLKHYFPSIHPENLKSGFIPRWKVTLLKDRDNNTKVECGYNINNIMNREKNIINDKNNIQNRENNIQDEENNILCGGSFADDIYFSKGLKDSFNNAVCLKVQRNDRTTAVDHFQDVRLITLSSSYPLIYNPGDIFTIRPRNCPDDVNDLFGIFNEHRLDIKPWYRLLVEETHEGMPVPPFLQTPLTLHQIAEQYWDLKAYPTQYVFSLLAHVSEDKLEKEKCIELSSPEGQEDWLNYSRRTRRTILEVLHDFHKTASKLTISILFELFSSIKPRSFSIASSNLQSPNSLDLLVAVVEYRTKLKMPRKGLCSNWLAGLRKEDGVYGWIKKGSFIFPEDASTPLILVSPGTGLAPMRSIIQQRYNLHNISKHVLHLFYGCRYRNKDFHCKEELEKMVEEGKLSLCCAFSRDQEEKVYVQHKISAHSSTLWTLIQEHKAYIYISGNAKNMPDNVKEAFINDVFKHGGMNIVEGNEYMKRMENEGRMQIEAW